MSQKLNRTKAISELSQDDLKKLRRNSVIKLSAMTVLLAVIVAFVSVAWFTMNRAVESFGVQMKAGDMPFEIATKGAGIRYSEIISQADSEYAEGDAADIAENTYYKSGSNDKLLLRYDTGESEIGPGDNGTLNLFVIPKQNGNLKVKVTLDVAVYVMLDNKDDEGNTVYQQDENGDFALDESGNKIPVQTLTKISADMADADNRLTETDVAEYLAAANYLKGHIMFFGGEGDTDNATESERYYYNTPYTTRMFTKTFESAEADKVYKIPIYWMWPNTLGQIALADNSTGQRNGYPILADSDSEGKALVAEYLKSNKASVFFNHTQITDEILSNPGDSNNFKLLSDGYNQADFKIGTNVSYFMIEVIVEGAE
ncbi:MAG: hypothetical protein ACI4JW_03305 [Oscillospiraceae bacterium]